MLSRLQRGIDDLAITTPGPPPAWRDWLLAAVLAGLSILELALIDISWPVARGVTAIIGAAVLPYRRLHPLAMVGIAFGSQFVLELAVVTNDLVLEPTFAQIVAVLILVYALVRWASARQAVIGLVVATVLFGLPDLLVEGFNLAAVLVALPWLAPATFALAMRYRAGLAEQREHRIRLTERHTLARELHDTVAHHVSAIAVQAQAAQYVARTDPDAAAEALQTVEQIANTAIDEMRRMVGVLRVDDRELGPTAPNDLGRLADTTGTTPVTLTGETDLRHLPSPVAVAVYRIAQESVTNARRHSRDLTFIDVDFATNETHVELEVTNDGVPTERNRGGGYGVIGMRERVEALGGTLETGARPASGWRVRASIPIDRPDNTSSNDRGSESEES